MSHLLDFYRQQKPDSEDRMLADMWKWDFDRWERHHDFIQWLFPLAEPSAVNPGAPLVGAAERAAFAREPELRSALRQSLEKFLDFIGLAFDSADKITRADHFDQRAAIWTRPNHNWLRMTRVLKSLRLLGLEREAQAFWRRLQTMHDQEKFDFGNSYEYWREAAEG